MLADESTALFNAKFHDRPVELRIRDYLRTDIRFLDMVNDSRRRKPGRIMDINNIPLGRINLVRHVRNRRDDIHIELPEQPLLNNLQMQKTEEAATETESQSHG